ncbi:MAG: hypothetical protein PHC88_05640 [Terrimicrobiaceae bacterium]|nr:hypothetical protein [Terrimicrobiaceae bacterium]
MPPLFPRNYGNTAKYEDALRRGKVYFACNSATQALSVNTTTATGLILTNPLTSGVNLVLLQVCVALITAPAAQANLVLTGNILTTAAAATTHTTALVVKNALISGGVAGQGLCDSAATVPTPAAIRSIGGGPVGAVTINAPYIRDDIDGLLALAPGCVISLQSMTTAITVVASITWEEVPVW